VRPAAVDEILAAAAPMYPPLERAEPVMTYAGLRPAGRGVNYVIGRSAACARLINVAAIRSTGLTASLGIAEHVIRIVAAAGLRLAPERALHRRPRPRTASPWW